MSATIFREAKSAKIVLFGVIMISIVLMLFQAFHVLVPLHSSLGILSGKTDNILGSWNSFGIFAGLVSIICLLVIEFFSITKIEKLILQILMVLSLVFVALVNFPLVWALIGGLSLIIFVYKISLFSKSEDGEGETKKKFPLFSFLLILVSLLFCISPAFIGSFLPNVFKIQNTEVSPLLGATAQVAKSVIKANPVFGIGPNKFGAAWALYKPVAINSTQFWDVYFNSGSGTITTMLATTGILGLLAWLLFFVIFIFGGVKSIFSNIRSSLNRETMAFFVLSLYLFISSIFYSSGSVLFLLAMAFAGISIGLYSSRSPDGELEISFLNDHRKSFFSILLLIILVLVSAGVLFKYVERFVSVAYYEKTLSAKTVLSAETYINKAIGLYTNDLYLRTYSQVYLVKLASTSPASGATLSDTDKANLQDSFNRAKSASELATVYDSTNYLNFQSLASVYETAAQKGAGNDAYNKAIDAYKSAILLNPNNPGLKLAVANDYIAMGDVKNAQTFASMALAEKPDYINALIILSQLAKSQGNNAQALSYAETALRYAPNNADLVKYVNSLKNSSSSSIAPASTSPATTTPKTTTPAKPVKK